MKEKKFTDELRRRNVERRRRELPSLTTLEKFISYYKRNEDGFMFSESSMRFFRTRFHYGMGVKITPNGLYFMHSDKKCFEDYRREYKIRWWSVEYNFYIVLKTMSYAEAKRTFLSLTTDVDFDPQNDFNKTEAGIRYELENLPIVDDRKWKL